MMADGIIIFTHRLKLLFLPQQQQRNRTISIIHVQLQPPPQPFTPASSLGQPPPNNPLNIFLPPLTIILVKPFGLTIHNMEISKIVLPKRNKKT